MSGCRALVVVSGLQCNDSGAVDVYSQNLPHKRQYVK